MKKVIKITMHEKIQKLWNWIYQIISNLLKK